MYQQPQRVPKMFVAMPKECPEEAEIMATLPQVLGTHVQLVSSGADFRDNVGRFGGWDGWIESVVNGREYNGSFLVPRFDAIIVAPGRTVGKATASLVQLAVRSKRMVACFTLATRQLAAVSGVEMIEAGNYKDGFQLY